MDTGSIRSLTNRKASQPRSPPPAGIGADSISDVPDNTPGSPVDAAKLNGHAVGEPVEKLDDDQNTTITTDSARTSKRVSHAFLDNVDLGDGPPSEQPKG